MDIQIALDGLDRVQAHGTRIQDKIRQGDSQMRALGVKMAARYEDNLVRLAPRRTGKFADSIRVESKSGGIWSVFLQPKVPDADNRQLSWIVEGTRPHMIFPRQKKALRFVSKSGKVVFTKNGVRHPGTKPNRFYVQAANETRGEAIQELRQLVERVFG